uniref:Uncharacterized protein n=1 Tax=Daucus carota subsp. sativus TaxID=79200 RepID=A0A166HHW0_DAUCS
MNFNVCDKSIKIYFAELICRWTFTLVLLYFAIGIIVSSRGCSMYSKKPSTQVADGDTLSKKDHHEKANNFTTNVKAIETKSLSGQEAGALEILMHSIYHACAGAVVLTDLVFWFILVPLMSGKDFKLTVVGSAVTFFFLNIGSSDLV